MNEMQEAQVATWSSYSYDALVAQMLEMQEIHKERKAMMAEAWAELTLLTDVVIPGRMDRDNIQNITVVMPDGSKRKLLILDQVSIKTPSDKKFELYEWLREHDAKHLITDTVNSSSLGGYVREQMRLGEPWPADICDINTYSRASLRKA